MTWPPFWSDRLPDSPALRFRIAQLYDERAAATSEALFMAAVELLRCDGPSASRAWRLACAAERRASRYRALRRSALVEMRRAELGIPWGAGDPPGGGEP